MSGAIVVHPLCSEAVSLHWLLRLSVLLLSSICCSVFFRFSLFPTVVSVELVKCWPIPLGPISDSMSTQTQFTGSKMCISYATTTKNKDANALSTVSLGVFLLYPCVCLCLCRSVLMCPEFNSSRTRKKENQQNHWEIYLRWSAVEKKSSCMRD